MAMQSDAAVVLLVEDEPGLREGLAHNLEFEGFEVRTAADGEKGLEAIRAEEVDIILLDVMMPRMDGLQMLERLRAEGRRTPVILLTAKGQEADKISGFQAGADDYVTKPFSVLELIARIHAMLRRSGEATRGLERFSFQDIEIDFVSMEVKKDGASIEFSLKELEMLKLLIARRGQAVSRADMLQQVWGYEAGALPNTRTIDTHVARIRSKLGGEDGCDFLRTVHKVGYKFQI